MEKRSLLSRCPSYVHTAHPGTTDCSFMYKIPLTAHKTHTKTPLTLHLCTKCRWLVITCTWRCYWIFISNSLLLLFNVTTAYSYCSVVWYNEGE